MLSKYKTVISVNGCFWHGHEGCKHATIPKINSEYWIDKIEKNKQKDKESIEKLEELGFIIIILWECEMTKDFDALTESTISKILSKETIVE